MSFFNKPLFVKKLSKRRWQVTESFSYFAEGSTWPFEKIKITVFKFFVTDLASTPRFAWSIFPPDGTYSQAAVLHDFLCEKKILSSKKTHIMFLDAMKYLGVPRWKRNLMYYSVKTFGPRWKMKRK